MSSVNDVVPADMNASWKAGDRDPQRRQYMHFLLSFFIKLNWDISKREFLLAQIRHKDAIIDSLLKHVRQCRHILLTSLPYLVILLLDPQSERPCTSFGTSLFTSDRQSGYIPTASADSYYHIGCCTRSTRCCCSGMARESEGGEWEIY